jgi:hypothetical protein
MKKLDKSDATSEHINAFVEDFEAQKSVALALIEDIKRLETQRVALMAETAVIVKQQMFGGVEVDVGSERVLVKREYGPSQIKIIEASLKIDPLIN